MKRYDDAGNDPDGSHWTTNLERIEIAIGEAANTADRAIASDPLGAQAETLGKLRDALLDIDSDIGEVSDHLRKTGVTE